MPSPALMLFVCVALSFGFLNGFNDSATIVATVISSRAMSPRRALALNALAHLTGPFLFGVAVATTIGHQVLAEQATSLPVAFSGLLAAILWGLLAWRMGVPSSSSHALIGGLVGAAVMGQGADALLLPGLTRVLLTLFLSPLVGLLVGYALMKVVLFLARGATPRINHLFRQAQALTMTALALSHMLDYAYTTVGEMRILDVPPNDYLRRIASLLVDAAREIHLGVQRLADHPGVAEDHAVRAKATENRVEWVYREALAALFCLPRDVEHVVEMLKLREIYRHLSNAADRGARPPTS
jgi:phosphate/sulfate permease